MAPEGAKAADPVTLGPIVVALSASGGMFTSVIETLRDWLGRSTGWHRIAGTIELERVTAEHRPGPW